MGALVTLGSRQLDAAPGAVATLAVTVKNTGTVVDQFSIDVLGDPAAFASSEPPTLSLFPGTDGKAIVTFAPPRLATTPSGALPFAIRARSQEDPAGSAVEEGVLNVGTYADTFAELVPRTSRGSRTGNHELAVDNRGNAHLNATVSAADPDQLLGFDVEPPGLVIEPGTAAFSKVRVKPRQRFWRGPSKTRPFKVAIASEAGPPLVLDGSMLQEAMLPRWLIPALLALLGALILGLIAWATLLQPAIKGAALQAMQEAGLTPRPSAGASQGGPSAGASQGGASAGASQGGAGASASSGAGGSASPSSSGGTTGSGSPSASAGGGGGAIVPGSPLDGRLSMTGASPNNQPFDKTYYLTDLVFANPNGRAGTLELRRSGFVLITLRLENFRDLDFHYVTPIVIQPKQSLELAVACDPPNNTTKLCDPSVYYSGFQAP